VVRWAHPVRALLPSVENIWTAYFTNFLFEVIATLVSLPFAGVLGATSTWFPDTFNLRLYSV